MDSNIKSYVYKLLTKRDYFEKELIEKLKRKGFEEKDILKVIEDLKQQGLIDDEKLKERYKEIYISKGKSYAKLKTKLYQKGILDLEISEDEELQAALNLLKKSFRKEKTYENVVKFLKNRGFRFVVIQKATREFLKEDND
ncbi:regulatory protein RecX [Sulfurihydrogenibium sp.]|uniref:regulatory protein RecX n=1 Tax=Sulfurihydrogenibium sp. TaxID=2053621 RepID=UPI000CB825F4|nr:MAG: RecX family transcriptional regulator [Sulfurihydrogenibium sp.]